MNSALPKVLHPLAGRPLLAHVIETARKLLPTRLVVVVGHGADRVREAVGAPDVAFALQAEQLGTGHAVAQALPLLDDSQPTLVLYGDVPLTEAATLQRLVAAARSERFGILTVEMDDPTGYGRIVREAGKIVRIVEQRMPASRSAPSVKSTPASSWRPPAPCVAGCPRCAMTTPRASIT